jgi:hypothetical protein
MPKQNHSAEQGFNHLSNLGRALMSHAHASKSNLKVTDQGFQCMMAVYLTDHTSNCYKMWDPTTGGIHTMKDINLLKRMSFPNETVGPSSESPPSRGDILLISNAQHPSLGAGERTMPINSEVNVATINKAEDK